MHVPQFAHGQRQRRTVRPPSNRALVAGLALACSALLAPAVTAVAGPQPAGTSAALAESHPPVVVSLTFDDANADQYQIGRAHV